MADFESSLCEHLTERERDVLKQLVLGKSNREIAEALDIANHTVRQHLINVFQKTGLETRLALAVAYYREQIVELEQRCDELREIALESADHLATLMLQDMEGQG